MNIVKRIKLLVMVILSVISEIVSFNCYSEIVSGVDSLKNCRYYRLTSNEVISENLASGEMIIDRGIYYNFYFRELRIDFTAKVVWLKIVKNRTLGINSLLFDNEFALAASNPQFKEIIATLGTGLALGIQPESVCLQGNRLVSVEFPADNSSKSAGQLPDLNYPEL